MRTLFPQEHENTCAVAAIRSALALQYRQNIPERVLEGFGTLAHRPIREAGTWASQMRRIVKEASRAFNTRDPWRMRIRSQGTISALARERRSGLYPICSVHAEDSAATDLHTVLVLNVGPKRLTIFDPSYDRPTWRSREAFMRWWKVEDVTWYAVVTGGFHEEQGSGISAG